MNLLGDIALQLRMLAQILFAMILAGLIGFERETKERPAGIRTHILVGGAATLFVLLGDTVTRSMLDTFGKDVIKADSVRILQAVMIGISFLGAGAILRPKDQNEVVGLTTAASILLTAGIGVTVASGQYILALGVTFLALVVLHGLNFLERSIGRKDR